jgi:hypothetical protein
LKKLDFATNNSIFDFYIPYWNTDPKLDKQHFPCVCDIGLTNEMPALRDRKTDPLVNPGVLLSRFNLPAVLTVR